MFEQDIHKFNSGPIIKVVGIGGSGNNAINRMVLDGVQGVDFVAVNTDAQVVAASKAKTKILLGKDLARGFGAGADPEVGRMAAEESTDEIVEALANADMVFIIAGMGGGTGTGAAPVVARIAKHSKALTVAIITKPFTFEGKERSANAYNGLNELKQHVDSYVVISNDKVMEFAGRIPLKDAFKEVDSVLRQSVQSIVDLVAVPAIINLDFADVKRVLQNKGNALIGIGMAAGENRAQEAAARAIKSPFVDSAIHGANTAIVNITGGNSFTIQDANEAVEIIRESTGTDTNIIFGVSVNDNLDDEMIVTVIATGNVDGQLPAYATPISRRHRRVSVGDEAERIAEQNSIETTTQVDGEEIKETRANDHDFDDLPAFLRRGRM